MIDPRGLTVLRPRACHDLRAVVPEQQPEITAQNSPSPSAIRIHSGLGAGLDSHSEPNCSFGQPVDHHSDPNRSLVD